MLFCDNGGANMQRLVKSRVGESLKRLQQQEGQPVEPPQHAHLDQFESWQKKWAGRRDQIAQRLTLIDSQLEQFSEYNRQKPQLSLVTACAD